MRPLSRAIFSERFSDLIPAVCFFYTVFSSNHFPFADVPIFFAPTSDLLTSYFLQMAFVPSFRPRNSSSFSAHPRSGSFPSVLIPCARRSLEDDFSSSFCTLFFCLLTRHSRLFFLCFSTMGLLFPPVTSLFFRQCCTFFGSSLRLPRDCLFP